MYRNNKQWAPNTEALDDYIWTYIPLNESADNIEHHGVKGQKWGVRRYQNRDGSLTPEGMKRYNVIHTKDGRTFYREKNYKQLKVQKIFDSLPETDKIDLPEKIIDPDHTVYESYRRSSFLTLEGHVTDQDAHPVKGLVVRVGTAEDERGKGDAGYLVRQAIREKPHNDFVAEISPGNETAADFFVNNGFEYVLTENGIDYYRFSAPGDNVDKVMADLSEKRKVRRHENRISVDVPVTHSDIWNPTELYHHGIKGQRWGVRRFQNKDGTLTEAGRDRYSSYTKKVKTRLSNSETANLDKWGKDREHNLLYITGLSGSGKSTVATYMADDGKTDYINLDSYFGQMSSGKKAQWQSKAFNKYLDKRVPNWKEMSNGERLNYDIVDNFAKALKDYSRIGFDEGKKVIAEGVQILDETLFESRSAYAGEPMIILKTNKKESAELASKRDGMKYVDSMLNKYAIAEKNVSELSALLGTKTGEQWVKDYINNLGLEND